MANFAKINGDLVTEVIVIANSDCDDLVFPASEPVGQAYIASLGIEGEWLQTSYNNNFRKQYAGIGYTYDATADVFVAPQPYPSWSLDENYDWQAPIAYPADGKNYSWDEANQVWVESPAI
jgi:hypothetical protein